jgi:ligand-binding sensor domain-containing protein
MKFTKLTFVFLLGLQFLKAQQPSYFILGKEPFEGVQIYDVIQDKNQNYWFATDQGFYRYNSHSFEKIECEGMKGLSAFGFVINKTGTIFCHNLNYQILKIEKDHCTVFYELSETERSSDMSLFISEENNLVVIARIPFIFDEKGKKIKSYGNFPGSYGFPFQTKRGMIICHSWEKNYILEIYQNTLSLKPIKIDSKQITGPLNFFRIGGKTYAVSNHDKTFYSFNEDNYTCSPLKEQPALKTQEFLRFYNVNNQLWIAGVAAGVSKLEGEDCSVLSEQMYSDHFISNVYKDSEGNILLSTFNHGVLVIPDLAIQDVLKLPEKQAIVSVHSDKDIGMILGTLKGELISFQKDTFQTLSNEGKKPLRSISSWPNFPYIIYDDGEVKAYHKQSGKITRLFEGSLKDATLLDSATLFLALNSGIRKISLNSSGTFQSESIESLKIRTYAIEVEPVTKNIFVATSDGLRIIKPDGKIERPVLEGANVFANDVFSDEQTLYVATKKDGILFFKSGEVVKKIRPKIEQNAVELYKLIIHDHKIYANSTQGFIVLDLDGNVLAKLNKIHGFSTNKIFDFEIIGEQIWIIHSRGFQKINIKHLDVVKEKPALKISRIEVNDKSVSEVDEKGEYSSNQRKIQFTISSPTLRNKENIRYHYKLVGYENDWLIAGYDDDKVSYNALAPGEYTFTVKAENQGVYSEIKEYAFSISKPFYFRWWFIVLEVLIFFFVVTVIYRWQLRIQRRKSEQQNELNASKLTAIQSQMNPHFIFNALNSIQDLILKGDVENSYSYITTFSNMVRKTLKYSERDFIDIDQELKLLELYLSLEKLRFKKDLEYTIQTENSEALMIPPLLIQPFIENSLVHGLLHKEGKKQLLITLKIGEMCICSIEDNGIGREKAKLIKQRQRAEHESFSSQAIQKRFEILSKTLEGNFGYVYEDLYEGTDAIGTRVTLNIPIKRKF